MSKTKNTTSTDKAPSGTAKKTEVIFAFNKQNYTLTLISVAVIFLGFVLMSGSEDIFSFTKLTLAPIVVIAGFALGIYAIMKKPVE